MKIPTFLLFSLSSSVLRKGPADQQKHGGGDGDANKPQHQPKPPKEPAQLFHFGASSSSAARPTHGSSSHHLKSKAKAAAAAAAAIKQPPAAQEEQEQEAAPASDYDDGTKRLRMDNIHPGLVKMEYAVRGKVVIAADKINEELRKRKEAALADDAAAVPQRYPFDHIVYTNIGNPQSVGQKPLTWPRQVLALADLPDDVGIDHPLAERMFPADAIARAREIKKALGGHGTGAYTHSKGIRAFRQDVADFITKRDGGLETDPENIFLTNGASAAISMVLNALISTKNTGVMIPIPQYPIYSATIDLLQGQKVGYYLSEENGWELSMEELERALQEAKDHGIDVNSFVLINPGNPSGAVLSRENLREIVKFCADNDLVLLADEVYQENVYDRENGAEFVSCKLAAHEMGLLENDDLELISFHSVSKGVFGECGRRGGYMELVGMSRAVSDQIYKLASSGLCSTVAGQIMTSVMVRGPDPGDVSYESHESEKRNIYESLKRRSRIVSEGLDSIDGFSCQPAKGAMYCFPSVQMPPGAIEAAEQQGISPDTLYAISLLEQTGICVVPASGFVQKQGRFGFRTTFLPSEDEMERCVELIRDHYVQFCKDYETHSEFE